MRSTYSYCTVICDSIKSMVLLDEKFITNQIDLYENTINQETMLHEAHFSHILAGPTIQEHMRHMWRIRGQKRIKGDTLILCRLDEN